MIANIKMPHSFVNLGCPQQVKHGGMNMVQAAA